MEESELWLPPAFDRSTDDDLEIQIDFEQSQSQLLSLAIALINQVDQLSESFRYRDSLLRLKKAFIIREKFLGEDHPDTATVYQRIADVYGDMNEYQTAHKWYQKALAVFERTLGSEHPNTKVVRNNIENLLHRGPDFTI